jgi:SPP1 family predicted phage head-tail adaptor
MFKLPTLGELDHRIEVQRLTGTVNAYNETEETYTHYAHAWARRTDASAGEGYRAKEVGGDVTAHFAVRYSPEMASVTPKDRLILEGGRVHNITGVRELARNQWLEIHGVARAE